MKKSDKQYQLSIISPVFCSAPILPSLVQQLYETMIEEELVDHFELLLVNDASSDNSWEVISNLTIKYPFIRGINLRRNVGQHNAIMAGLHQARGQFVALIDDDLQHPPNSLKEMLNALKQGYDVCYTNYINRQHIWWKRWGSHFSNYVANILIGKPKWLYLSSYKLIRLEIAKEIIKYDGPYTFIDGLILNVTQSITTINIIHQPRLNGKSHYTLKRLFSLWLKMATNFSILPLRIATCVGLTLSVLSLIITIIIILIKIKHPEYPSGWASLITVILFIGGVQTFCIGIIGEYLGRVYLKLNHKPQFVIKEMTGVT